MIVSETPGVVGYYLEKFGQEDARISRIGNKMKEVRERFALVYAGCIQGHTAAEVYASQADVKDTVKPCGDARP